MSVGAANMAYLNALDRANREAQSTLRSYGYVAPNAGGTYSSENLFGAFDPQTIIDPTTGEIDKAKFEQSAKGMSIGGTGRLADIQREGADIEAEARAASAASGIRGGIAQQRTSLAEYQASKNLMAGKTEFLTSMAGAYSPISGAYSNLQVAKEDAKTQAAIADAEARRIAAQDAREQTIFNATLGSLGQPNATPAANQPVAKPTTPGTKLYERRGPYQWFGKAGWKKAG